MNKYYKVGETMATVKEIERLLKKVNITIDEEDIESIIDNKKKQDIQPATRIEEFLIKNASIIDIKRLLTIVVRKLDKLAKEYEKNQVSKLLEKNAKEELKKAVEFSKLYVKENEKIKIFEKQENGRGEILTSQQIIYGKTVSNENERYDKIKDFIPQIEEKDISNINEILRQILGEEYIADMVNMVIIDTSLEQQGYTEKDVEKLLNQNVTKERSKFDVKGLIDISNKVIKPEIYNENLRSVLEETKSYIDANKYLLFHTHRLNAKLEEQEELNEKEIELLDHLEELAKEIKKGDVIKFDKKKSYGILDLNRFITRWNKENQSYITQEQLKSGEKLIKDTNGYDKYLSKEELKELAKIEGNLVYLAKEGRLSSGNIASIIRDSEVSQQTLVELYNCEALSLIQLEKYAKDKQIDLDEIKELIKKQKISNLEEVNINDKETWELLNKEEKIKAIIYKIEKEEKQSLDNFDKSKLDELYSIEEIAELYKKIHVQKDTENTNQYDDLIQLYNLQEKEQNDEIITLLEDEFSNEMLINLYNDKLINLEILESYGEKELVVQAFQEGKIHSEDLQKVIKTYPVQLEESDINKLYQEGIISKQDIIEIYVNGKVKLETIKKLNEELPQDEKIEEYLSEDQLINLYKSSKKNQEDIIKYKRYKLIYQTLKREALEENEKQQLDKKILEENEFTKEDIEQLYKDNLLALETVLAYGKEELVEKLAIEGSLKPSDAKIYFESEKERANIEAILQNPRMNDTEKIILIYSTYDNNKEKRDYLVNYLQAHSKDIQGETNTKRKEQEEKNKENKDAKRTVTDPYERWKLFSTLDENYTKRYVGGYLVVNLNNTQKTIIEKMYQKRKNNVVPAYGTATFALNTEDYLNIEDEIISKDRINISNLRKIAKENPEVISKITHHPPVIDAEGNEKNSWGKRVLEKICNGEVEEIYTKEEIEQIEKCMQDIERSREELNR